MQKATVFEFSSITPFWNEARVEFGYTIHFDDGSSEVFVEKLNLPSAILVTEDKSVTVENALQALHLILGISHFKLYCPSEISIKGYSLDKDQAEFWNTVYTKGLGEFFYRNQIDFRGLVKFPSRRDEEELGRWGGYEDMRSGGKGDRSLVLIGGGKDSIVSAEIVKESGELFDFFAINVTDLQKDVAGVLQKDVKTITRVLDPKILEYATRDDVYQGHVPISVVYTFVSLLYAILFDYHYIIASNEHSSSYGSVEYLGMEINHQWSKGIEFENLFREYCKKFVTSEVTYFSLLRPLHEIFIAKIFTKYPQYFTHFSSSNHNFKIDASGKKSRWDLEYSKGKVEFVYAILSAFLPKNEMDRVFGCEPYALESTVVRYKELLGKKDIKPLDCVGTPEETTVALYMAHQKEEYAGTPVMEYFEKEVLPTINNIKQLKSEVFSYGDDRNIPGDFREVVKETFAKA